MRRCEQTCSKVHARRGAAATTGSGVRGRERLSSEDEDASQSTSISDASADQHKLKGELMRRRGVCV